MQIDKSGKYIKYWKAAVIAAAVVIMGIFYIFRTDETQFIVTEQQKENKQEESVIAETNTVIYVYVCGSIKNPGVYKLAKDTRIYEAVELAGGLSEQADESSLNMAGIVNDGQKIYIPAVGEVYENTEADHNHYELLNINTATKEQLMTLPGIGEARAEDIISYRKSNGKFNVTEDIKNVSGIKDSAFNKIKDLITVR